MLAIRLVAAVLSATNLVTGNGFGFAVVSPGTATITKFYAHPYSFARPDPQNPLSEGIETTNFFQSVRFPCGTAAYEQDSHVIRVRCAAGTGAVFMPFGFAYAALIVSWPGDFQVEWSHRVRSRVAHGQFEVLTFDGVEESLLVVPLPSGRAFISVEPGTDPAQVADAFNHWRAEQTAPALAAREIAELERWRVPSPPKLAGRELHLWRQSEVMLRMAQSREPNRPGRYNNGLIVASLPDGVWFTPWVRDMTWAAVALTRMGHRAEARAALLAYFNARPTGKMRDEVKNANYQVSVVRYFGDGAEEPFFTMEGSTNIEFDDWGEVLWLLGEYTERYRDTTLLSEQTGCGPLYQCARDLIWKPLVANLEPYGGGLIVDEDTSIWEEHQKDRKHFAFSTAMAIVGLKSLAGVAQLANDDATRREILGTVAQLEKGFAAAFIRGGTLHGTLEDGVKNDIDGALLAIIHLGVVTDSAIVRSTVQRMALLKVASGGYERVRSNYTDPAIFEYWYERQEFLFVDFSLAEVDRQLGRDAEAAALIERIVEKAAADHDIIPEMYVALPCKLFPGAIGDPTGARPMVGYGAGAYILDVLDRQVPAWPFSWPVSASAYVPDSITLRHIPRSQAAFTEARVDDVFDVADWFPESHPTMPAVVVHGRKPAVLACAYCHLPDGAGRPENATLAGLPAAYIAQQVADIKSGARRSALSFPPFDYMHRIASNVTDSEVAEAAQYYTAITPRRRSRVVETTTDRLTETPDDSERHELRDPYVGYTAYVPRGSMARGRALAEQTCARCHGSGLQGVGLVPPLAGRSPSYLLRQLIAFQSGARSTPAGAPMQAVAATLTLDDMIAAAAYAGSRSP